MSSDLESRARQAASAAHASVLSAATQAARAEPARRRPIAHLGAAVVASIVLLGGITAVLLRRDTDTRITTGPAASPITSLPAPPVVTPTPLQDTSLPPPPPGPPPPPSAGPVLGTGAAKNGERWTLSIGGPSNELCLHFSLGEGSSGGTCAGKSGGAPVPADERYRPLLFQDLRLPAFVFGLVPAGVAEVEAELVTGPTKTRTRVLTGASDGSYAIEVDRPEMIKAVIGYRTDGTTLRYPLAP